VKRAALLTAALSLVLLSGCIRTAEDPPGRGLMVYYSSYPEAVRGQDAIVAAPAAAQEGDTRTLARALICELLAGAQNPELQSPFPPGTELLDVSISGKRALVDLSEPYARLSGIDLSIADYCLTLTLTQLEGVNAVTVTAEGWTPPYRKTQLLTAADPLLGSREDALRPVTVQLYFLDTETQELRAQQQTLALYEGQTRVSAVLDALMQGPEAGDTLQAVLPENFSVLSSRTDGAVCYLNLPGNIRWPADEAERRQIVESLTRSLTSLSGIEEVQILIEGENTPF